jgi:hypothetical protein
MTPWTDLDQAYLEIFGEHPALSVATPSVTGMNTTPTPTIGHSTYRDCSWCHKNARHLATESGWYCCRCGEITPLTA